MKIFLDTNILVNIIEEGGELPSGHHYCTFEKCVYELKNGYKRKFYDSTFLRTLLTAMNNSTKITIDNPLCIFKG